MFHWKKNSIQKQRYLSACSFHFTCSLASRSFQSISISQWLLKINKGENGRKEDDDKQLNRCIWTDGREHPLNSLSICVGFCANAIEHFDLKKNYFSIEQCTQQCIDAEVALFSYLMHFLIKQEQKREVQANGKFCLSFHLVTKNKSSKSNTLLLLGIRACNQLARVPNGNDMFRCSM